MPKKHIIALMAAAAPLTGCTTSAAKLGVKEPRAVLSSAKAPAALTPCIADALSSMSTPSVIPIDGGSRIVVSSAGQAFAEVRVTNAASGSTVEIRSTVPLTGKPKNALAACL